MSFGRLRIEERTTELNNPTWKFIRKLGVRGVREGSEGLNRWAELT